MPLELINDVMLHYDTTGEGVPIIFIHPPLLTSANFAYQREQLSNHFQIVTFDIRGHGHSRPAASPLTYDLIAKDIIALMDHLYIEKAFVCGYSTGGSIALEAMLAYPDRFLGGIMISAMSEASDFMLRSRIRMAVAMSKRKWANKLLEFAISFGNADNLSTFQKLLRDAKPGDRRTIQHYYQYSLIYNCTSRLSAIEAPVLLVYGEKDRGFKQYCAKLQHMLPNTRLVIIPNEKHQLPTKAAPQTNHAILQWIQEVINLTTPRK